MELLNRTPFAAERFVFLHEGLEMLLVVVKGTFTIHAQQDTTRVADEQEPVVTVDEYGGDPTTSSIRRATDVVPAKPATDVLLRGHAYTTQRSRTETLVAMQLGTIKKGVRVVGERVWSQTFGSSVMSDPLPFHRMELLWERAFGGTDASNPENVGRCEENPVGRGFRVRGSKLPVDGAMLPNLESLAHPIQSPGDHRPPSGFGPIAPSWRPRVSYAGTYDDTWRKDVYPFLPKDFDVRFHQCAPPDQILPGHVKGGEAVNVVGISETGQLRFTLPHIRPALAIRVGNHFEEPPLLCDTIIIAGERPAVILIWRASLIVQGRVPNVRTIEVKSLG
ncbi:hypothetical protein CYFUS_006513 [Cystobacter fuscus]|uniref:DUF2169 domain-containing protein n=1 Tax=Cystobacter fuscus TaxID=43 RepID=A0A250JCB6_9BACT|nr:DUF2169 domain-containing protein [Cystobacter fuscus]ATB41051.1 hypothetical protein CYFUS_006513 [Cystobacter fuscus]